MSTLLTQIILTIKRYNYKNINYRLIIYVCILTTIGIFAITSATSSNSYEIKQIGGFVIGLIAMVFVGLVNYNFILRYYWVFYGINILFLISVQIFGSTKGGAERWIDFGIFQLQPSELSKLFMIIFFAMFLTKYRERINEWKFLLIIVGLFIVPFLLVLTQPALSTSIVIFLMFCAIIFSAGLSYKIIGRILAVILPVLIIVLILCMTLPNHFVLKDYQYNRIIGFYDSNNEVAAAISYQQENSVMAIGSGGLLGKGLSNNTVTSVKNGDFISEPHTDFIFTIVGEEMGLLGTVSVIVLLGLIVFECFMTGLRAYNFEGRLICFAFGSLLAFQAFINMAVVTMMIPNTGITLPFVSYGLSSLVSLFIGVGLVLNVGLQQRVRRVKLLGGYNEHRFNST